MGLLNSLKMSGGYDVTVTVSPAGYEALSEEYDVVLFRDLRMTRIEATLEDPYNPGLLILRKVREKGLPTLVLDAEPIDIAEIKALGARIMQNQPYIHEILGALKKLEEEKKE